MRRAAARLVRQGIVSERVIGRSRLYELNREHVAAEAVAMLAGIRGQLIDKLRKTVEDWQRPAAAVVLFGSVANRTASEDSDLDLLVVRPQVVEPDDDVWQEQLERLSRDATAWTGNDARILELDESEVLSDPPPVVLEALAEGVDVMQGRELLRRIKRAQRA